MSGLWNIAKNWFFFVLQIATPAALLIWLFYRSDVDQLPDFTRQEALTISLAAMQVTLAALAIFIGIAAIVGYQALQQTAKTRAGDVATKIADEIAKDVAGEIAQQVATKQVKSYLEAHLPKEALDDLSDHLRKNSEERPEKGTKERRETNAGGRAV